MESRPRPCCGGGAGARGARRRGNKYTIAIVRDSVREPRRRRPAHPLQRDAGIESPRRHLLGHGDRRAHLVLHNVRRRSTPHPLALCGRRSAPQQGPPTAPPRSRPRATKSAASVRFRHIPISPVLFTDHLCYPPLLHRTAAVKGVASDLFAQLAIERQRPDFSRTLAFASFGALYLGAFASWKYGFLYSALFGTATSAAAVSAKVGVDMLISAPFVYFPLYFIMKGLFAGKGILTSLRQFTSRSGLSILMRYWFVWLPVETIMWIVVPPHLRVAFLCGVSLVWQVALSTLSYRIGDASNTKKVIADVSAPYAESSASAAKVVHQLANPPSRVVDYSKYYHSSIPSNRFTTVHRFTTALRRQPARMQQQPEL